jgi:transposase
MPSSIGYSVTEQTTHNSHEAASAEKRRRWAIVEKMAREGYSNEEIMKATGYKTAGTVKSIVHQMREQGIDIPERRRGCKKQG